eukprot:INCI20211.1.p1 GENE.INCI20211.1~~INCI20211.1.p1  ORF type:complete len:398 (+),score=42.11 INCI20211.1:113-1306(+)
MASRRVAFVKAALLGAAVGSSASATGSVGCGSSKGGAVPGECTEMAIDMAYGLRSYLLCLPASYVVGGKNTPVPVVLNFHGWGDTMNNDLKEAQVWAAVKQSGVAAIVVHPQGYADHSNSARWGSWHINGTSESPGPAGPTCTAAAGTSDYCYDSCKSDSQSGDGTCQDLCSWTTCVDDYEFVNTLLDEIETNFCVDTAREYATGCSNGGMMAYGLGANAATRFAAIAPQCGSFHRGFLDSPDPMFGMPLMDVHGDSDFTVPANLTAYNVGEDTTYPLSADGWYYTQVADIMSAWRVSNACVGESGHFKTPLDGTNGLYCISEGECARGALVRCAWVGGHDYFGGSHNINSGQLVWSFLQQWTRPCHVGFGVVDSSISCEPVATPAPSSDCQWWGCS